MFFIVSFFFSVFKLLFSSPFWNSLPSPFSLFSFPIFLYLLVSPSLVFSYLLFTFLFPFLFLSFFLSFSFFFISVFVNLLFLDLVCLLSHFSLSRFFSPLSVIDLIRLYFLFVPLSNFWSCFHLGLFCEPIFVSNLLFFHRNVFLCPFHKLKTFRWKKKRSLLFSEELCFHPIFLHSFLRINVFASFLNTTFFSHFFEHCPFVFSPPFIFFFIVWFSWVWKTQAPTLRKHNMCWCVCDY